MATAANLLIINPNSSQSMTDEVRVSVERCGAGACNVTYMTGPAGSPPQIDGAETSVLSCQACLPLVEDPESPFYYGRFDGILVACFSDHPLAAAIQRLPGAPVVLGLLSCSVSFAALNLNRPFSIITSNEEWVAILNAQTEKFLTKDVVDRKLWRGTVSSKLQVLQLHEPQNFQRIVERIQAENVTRLGSTAVILGCAGFSGLQYKLAALIGGTFFVDPVVLGFRTLLTTANYLNEERARAM